METLSWNPDELAERLFDAGSDSSGAILVCGATGTGKSTLVGELADRAVERGKSVRVLDADPGSPRIGPPGAVTLASRRPDAPETAQIEQLEALATLDAGRFRLPVIDATTAIVARAEADTAAPLLVDPPGLDKGIPATELIPALIRATDASRVLVMVKNDDPPDMWPALEATPAALTAIEAPEAASKPSSSRKAGERTTRWNRHLADARTRKLDWTALSVVGAPPPADVRDAWPGRQIGLLDADGRTLAFGEIEGFDGRELTVRCPDVDADIDHIDPAAVHSVVIRDARRNRSDRLRTDTAPADTDSDRRFRLQSPFTPRSRADLTVSPGSALTARAGRFRATLIGGFFDDPTVHVEAVHADRSMLFDLGEIYRYPTGVLNRVSDLFVSHAHLDHFAGFVTFLRTRVHGGATCRVWGPAGLSEQVASLLDGFTWDRLASGDGPCFEVGEFDGTTLRRVRVAPNTDPELLEETRVSDGILRREARFQVRARVLEHGTDSIAWALEEEANLNVRSDRLGGDYPPGPWLGELKRCWSAGDRSAEIETPTGHRETVDELADHLLVVRPGEHLVYATDFADTPDNRRKVHELADGADVLFCESFYSTEDADAADRYRHLTTAACGEIARRADVDRLIPFHFSSRYEYEPERLYREILEYFDRVEVPEAVAERMSNHVT